MGAQAMRVNHLPAITWNALRMNAGVVREEVFGIAGRELGLAALRPSQAKEAGALPAGLSCTLLSFEEASAWLGAHAPAQEAERVVAGKTPVYHAQRFGTGAGAEFDALLVREKAPCALLTVAAGTRLAGPLVWDLCYADGERAAGAQVISVEEGAEADVVLCCRSERAAGGFAGLSVRVLLARGARLRLSRVQLLGDRFLFVGDLGVSAAEDAAMEFVQLELGGGEVFAGAEANLCGDRSALTVRSGYLGEGERRLDLNYNVIQRGKKTRCDMTFDGVLRERAHKIFRGTIDFRSGAAAAVGEEQENVLLLGQEVENESLPVILCEEENVEGRHGATIGRLDEAMLFYMESRGIGEREAQELLVRARLGAVARRIPDPALCEAAKKAIG